MRVCVFIALFLTGLGVFAQDSALAKHYFDEGSFEKAVLYYEKLYRKTPARIDYLQALVACYQQLEQYETAQKLLLNRVNDPYNSPVFFIELGYNYALQGDDATAETHYNNAIKKITENPSYAYVSGNAFQRKSLLDYAIKAFKAGIAANPSSNFTLNYSIASIYGEMGDIEKMYDTYLTLIDRNQSIVDMVKRRLGAFISDDPESEDNILFKKALLKKTQTAPNTTWNDLLSWLFIQQKQFGSALVQEKAIYKRSGFGSVDRVMQLGLIAMEERDNTTAKASFKFALDNAVTYDVLLEAHLYLLRMEIAEVSPEHYPKIEDKFTSLFKEYGYVAATVPLQIAYARFLVFQNNNSKKAVTLLRNALKLNLNAFDESRIKMVLADVLVYEEKFNQALIYYAQIQKLVKNDELSQTARFKTAQASFYKGDFKWAETQLKVLKSSTSQLIANDALQLKLLISDNAYEDSTQTALKLYAKADLLAYQNKNTEAIALLDTILNSHKGESIEDEALFKQAQLFQQQKQYDKARLNYVKVISFFSYDILMDDALFALAQLYEHHFNDPEKAKEYYEKLIFDHQDSIYFVTARKRYRTLRGDAIR